MTLLEYLITVEHYNLSTINTFGVMSRPLGLTGLPKKHGEQQNTIFQSALRQNALTNCILRTVRLTVTSFPWHRMRIKNAEEYKIVY